MSLRINIEPGTRFGHLVVVENTESKVLNGRRYAASVVKCDCGKIFVALNCNVRKGHTTSCGCSRRKARKHGDAHRGCETRLYTIWCSMKGRCSNDTFANRHYCGRGIRVCNEWANSYSKFKEWATSSGYCNDLTIDRLDNNKGYNPYNCRWIKKSEQSANRRTVRNITIDGKMQCLAAWAREYGLSESTLAWRIDHGVSPELAITKKVGS